MTFTDSLASYELPPALVRPALRACRGFNTGLDTVFYDTPALRGDVDLGVDVDPEGSLLRVDPARAPYITAWKDVVDFLDSQAAAPEPIGVASITGVGSSALGSAALAWNVAVGLKRPVLAIVPGYGLADVVLQGLGGWFGFGLTISCRPSPMFRPPWRSWRHGRRRSGGTCRPRRRGRPA